ncbi:rod-determining factor RdfA [Halobellus rubicundus]|uniref:Rod-determining factor RdfA n=1 Tax=Halobellus rubicundus TaxID=2996466 RepID=A0ABD5MCY9_9EURY
MTDTPDPTRSKVGDLIHRYEMGDIGRELEDRWLGNGYDSQSLRSLAEWFNRRLLRTKLERNGMTPLDGEVANMYRLLSSDDVTAGARVEAESTLEDNGIDPERLKREFVSHQAIHTYLTKFRGASKDGSSADPREKAQNTIQKLRNRLIAVIENSLEQLRERQRITLGEFNILLDIQILCEDCGASYSVTELFDRGGCDCEPESEA